MNIDKLLVECRSDDLAHALRELGLPVTGTKPEDLRRAAKAIEFEGA